jgi:hypothetical protein
MCYKANWEIAHERRTLERIRKNYSKRVLPKAFTMLHHRARNAMQSKRYWIAITHRVPGRKSRQVSIRIVASWFSSL